MLFFHRPLYASNRFTYKSKTGVSFRNIYYQNGPIFPQIFKTTFEFTLISVFIQIKRFLTNVCVFIRQRRSIWLRIYVGLQLFKSKLCVHVPTLTQQRLSNLENGRRLFSIYINDLAAFYRV